MDALVGSFLPVVNASDFSESSADGADTQKHLVGNKGEEHEREDKEFEGEMLFFGELLEGYDVDGELDS